MKKPLITCGILLLVSGAFVWGCLTYVTRKDTKRLYSAYDRILTQSVLTLQWIETGDTNSIVRTASFNMTLALMGLADMIKRIPPDGEVSTHALMSRLDHVEALLYSKSVRTSDAAIAVKYVRDLRRRCEERVGRDKSGGGVDLDNRLR